MDSLGVNKISLNTDEMQLYSRQILLDDWDFDAQERLKQSSVLIIGAGGIGCSSAELLARSGVGEITIIDADIVEMSNIQRQIAFTVDDLGLSKVQVLANRLKKINPYIQVNAINIYADYATLDEWVRKQNLILDGCDNFKTRYLVNQVCKEQGVPLISASAIAFDGQLLMIDKYSACYECLFPRGDIDVSDTEFEGCNHSGVLATTPTLMATLQAHHALLLLGLQRTPLKQKLLLWNGLTCEQRILHFTHDVNCKVCKKY